MPTPHIEANVGEIAEIVIMPGDPLRAKMIAEKYLNNVTQINKVRNMFGYTGEYKGRRITTMGSGMGMPSMGIYCHELYEAYGVKKIIRVGTCGAYRKEIKMLDLILADSAYTESNFAYTFNNSKDNVVYPSEELTNRIYEKSKELNIPVIKGTIMSSDCFYIEDVKDVLDRIPEGIQIDGVEMEAFALFHTAKTLGTEAACIASVVDNHHTKEELSSETREQNLYNMIELALEALI